MSKARLLSKFVVTSANIENATIQTADIADNAITDTKLSTNLAANISGIVPKITLVSYPNADLAASTAGGDTIFITGSGFQNGITVFINTTQAPSVSFTNSTSISFTTPALSAGDYTLYLINPDGSTGIAVPGLSVSGTPTWVTSAGSLAATTERAYSNVTLNAESDSNVTYSIASGNLPPGLILNSNTGLISGTVLSNVANLASNTTYNFTIDAQDQELQNTIRSFSITYIPTFPTWFSPNTGSLTAATVGVTYTANLNAISNSGIVYSIPSGNLTSNISISSATLTGTPTNADANTYYFTIRATDAEGHATDREFSLTVNVGSDTYFNYTTLLLTGDGTNGAQNNSFQDSSANNFTITRNGNTTQGTFSPFSQDDGKWGAYFDGSGDSLTFAQSSDFNLTGDFCVQAWAIITVDPSGISNYYPRLCAIGDYNSANNFHIELNDAAGTGARGLYPCIRINTSITDIPNDQCSSTPLALNTWTHICLVRSGTNVSLYLNGTRTANFTNSGTTSFAGPLYVGAMTGGNSWTGYISNFSIVNGSAIFDPSQTTITVPTSPLATNTTNQKLLTCYSNRFIDSNTATTAKAATVNGNTSIQPFSPFAPSAAYSAATNGGSGYFDGSGDNLTASGANTANAMGTGNWTAEAWIYLTSGGGTPFVFDTLPTSSASATGLRMRLNSSNQLQLWQYGSAVLTSSTAVTVNAWTHVALVKNSGTTTAYVNGVASGTYSDSGDYICGTNRPMIGSDGFNNGSANSFPGYISNLRLVKGTAVYTSSFTPPTSPLTSVSGTGLLLNFTNAGILDNTGRNVLETVGNAQISTSVKKFGTGSLAFDGSGDYLLVPSSQLFTLGSSGDFTLECWIYRVGTSGTIATTWTSSLFANRYLLYLNGSNAILWHNDAGGTAINGGTISATTWTHIAVVRNGSTITMYVNGTSVGTQTSAQAFTTQADLRIGGGITGNGNDFNGYIDDLRITKGVARYTANFTPQTSAFPLR